MNMLRKAQYRVAIQKLLWLPTALKIKPKLFNLAKNQITKE